MALATAALIGFGSGAVQAATLKATIDKALATNPEVLGAVANRQVTENELGAAKGPRYPSLDLHTGSGREWTHTASMSPGDNYTLYRRREVGVTIRQILYDGGATSGEIARQAARLQSLDSRVFDVSDSLAQRVVDVYLEVLKATELYNLALENVETHRKYLQKMRDRVSAGVGARADLNLAEGREALAYSTLTSREAGLADAKIRFRRLVGEMPSDLVQPDSVSKAVPALVELASEIAYANNASLKAARAEVIAAKEAESASRSRFGPVFSLDAGITRNKSIDGVWGPNNDKTVMFVMNYNLFKGGADRAKTAELGARLTSAMESENNVRRTIEEEVGRAWVALNAAKASLDYLKEHAARTAEVKDSYQSQFDVGKRTMLDLMNAENEVFMAKSSLVGGRYSVAQSEYRVIAVMGGIQKVISAQITPESATGISEKPSVAIQKTVETKQAVPPIETRQTVETMQAPQPAEAKQETKTPKYATGQEARTAEDAARIEADAKVARLKAKIEARKKARNKAKEKGVSLESAEKNAN